MRFFKDIEYDGHLQKENIKFCDMYLEYIPLSSDYSLHKDTEKEEESLVHCREVHTNVEREEEDQLDKEAGVDEDIGDPRPDPDSNARGR